MKTLLAHRPRLRGNTLAVLLVIIGVLFAAGALAWLLLRRPAPDAARTSASYLPAETIAVFTVQASRLLEKSDLPALLKKNLDRIEGARMFINPDKLDDTADMKRLGLRPGVPWQLFIHPGAKGNPVLGLILPLQDRRAFEQALRELPAGLGMQFLNRVKPQGGLHGIFDARESFAVAYDEHMLILLAQEKSTLPLGEMVTQLFARKRPLTTPSFTALAQADADATLWVDVSRAAPLLPDKAAREAMPALPDWLKGELTASVRFENGAVKLEGSIHAPNGKSILPAKPTAVPLALVLPGNAVVAVLGRLDTAALQDALPSLTAQLAQFDSELGAVKTVIENFLGLSLTELQAQLQGDVVLALTDVTPHKDKPAEDNGSKPSFFKLPKLNLPQIPIPKFEFLAGATFHKPEQAQQLAQRLSALEGFGIGSLAVENTLYLATSPHREALAKSNRKAQPLPDAVREQMAGSDAALYVNFKRLTQVLGRFENVPDGLEELKALEHLTLSLRQSPGQVRAQATLTLAEGLAADPQNSLRRLFELALDTAAPPRRNR